MEDQLLHEVFQFRHKSPSTNQSSQTCCELVSIFARFVNAIEVVEARDGVKDPYLDELSPSIAPVIVWKSPPLPGFSNGEHKQLLSAIETASLKTDVRVGGTWIQEWFPAYGCALQITIAGVASASLRIVFPDGWKLITHTLPSGQSVKSAISTVVGESHCGEVDPDELDKVFAHLKRELETAQSRTGSDRHASKGAGIGNQKTPAFIASLVKRAIFSVAGCTDVLFAPTGGTTDVGQHTGGQARATCWAVVCAVLQRALLDGGALWRKTLAAFLMHLLEFAVSKAEGLCLEQHQHFDRSLMSAQPNELHIRAIQNCDKVDDFLAMLQSVVRLGVDLLEKGHDISQLLSKTKALRERINGLVEAVSQRLAGAYSLPDSSGLQQWSNFESQIKLVPPPHEFTPTVSATLDDVHQYAMLNLGLGTFIDGSTCTFRQISEWVDSTKATTSSPYSVMVVLRGVERYMIAKSELLVEASEHSQQDWSPDELQQLIAKYASCVEKHMRQESSGAHLVVEQRSMELLVTWIGFCLVHQQSRQLFPLLNKFKIALDWKDLAVVVLSDHKAVAALQNVAQYIRAFCASASNQPVFHLTRQSGMIQFAREYANMANNFETLRQTEERAWQNHVSSNWVEIVAKQRHAKELRSSIDQAEELLAHYKRVRERVRQDFRHDSDYRHWSSYPRGRSAEADVRRQESQLSSLKKQLSSTLQMPSYLVRALPYDENEALTILFFLNMPRNLEILSELCLEAQLSLCPSPLTSEILIERNYNGHSIWLNHFHSHKQSGQQFNNRTFELSNLFGQLPRSLGPTSVDFVYSEADYEKRCVWTPPYAGSKFKWSSGGRTIDPFRVLVGNVQDWFTERLPQQFKKFQWINSYPHGEPSRGNQVYARLDDFNTPDVMFDVASSIALGSLRAFPNQQLRQLLCCLKTDALPWEHPCTQVTVRQAVYQVGALTDELRPSLRWKTDLQSENHGIDTFVSVLDTLAASLEQTPRAFEQVPLLSELASFLDQYALEGRQVVIRFVRMARVWAKQSLQRKDGESAGHAFAPIEIAKRRAKACLLYGYALIGFSLLDSIINHSDIKRICTLVVQFRTNLLFSSRAPPGLRNQILLLERRTHEIMMRHIASITREMQSTVGFQQNLLTHLLDLVINRSDRTSLMWKRASEMQTFETGSCFFAIDETTQTHYSVNLFNGCVLMNGMLQAVYQIAFVTTRRSELSLATLILKSLL